MFIDSAQIWRSHHLAQQKAWMSFYTDQTGSHHRKVATDWKDAPRDSNDLEDEAVQVITELDSKFCHGAYKLFVCFNSEDPQNFSPEYDRSITIRLKLTPHLPLLGPKNQIIKLFSHFSAVVEQGDGHLIHYKKVEFVALQVLQLLKASDRVRNSLLHDSNAEEDSAGYTVFHAVVEFLKSFCECEPHYRALFVKKEVFEFLVSCIALAEQVPVSQMLVSVFANNDMRVNLQFVNELIQAMEENFSKNKQSSLNALMVLKSIVTTFADNVETRDNGSIIMRRFMDQNTEKRIENPYIPMAFEAFRDQVEFMIGDNESIGDHIKRMLLEDKEGNFRRVLNFSTLKMATCCIEKPGKSRTSEGHAVQRSTKMAETVGSAEEEEAENASNASSNQEVESPSVIKAGQVQWTWPGWVSCG
eukprot:symbB.v1.2.018338.t1/scaffold1459.1/size118272/2